MYNLLVIDDDTSILEVVKIYFTAQGFCVSTAESAKRGLAMIDTLPVDCVLLDIALPDMDGFEACNAIKEKRNIPIIFLSNYGEEERRIGGFMAGGDDYLVKPFSLKELELRVYARIRQGMDGIKKGALLEFGKLVINESARSVSYDDEKITLTAAEFDILYFLATHMNQVFSQKDIYENIWKLPDLGNAHTVQVHVAQIRRKLNTINKEHAYIETVWGKGYKFVE